MNYSEFYKNSKRRLTDALVSMWASGHSKEQECLRELLEEKEPLIAEPVFQTIFPWQPAKETFEEHASKLHVLDEDFVKALSEIKGDSADFCFPANRCPYTHQSESWKAMLNGKTIAVTSGTGSGKTECFIIPVLQDLYRERCKSDYTEGVQAIFLYPLNALMKNQRERIDAWCRSLPKQVDYAIYNGDMEEDRKVSGSYPQICTRDEMRKHPPQILFTNPTMLNYMMVRSKDLQILEKSHGRLRWILLDEAHTYSGSAATELALQIRRVIDAFGVTIDDVNFAVTSATMGGKDAEKKLKTVVAQLTGKDSSSIQVINGNRVIPDLEKNTLQQQLNILNQKHGTELTVKAVDRLRKKLNERVALSAEEIANDSGLKSNLQEDRLSLIDDLSTEVPNLGGKGKNLAVLPTRAHFFMRAISGLYACVNSECKNKTSKSLGLGNFTTYQNAKCPHCGGNMVEVASCTDCGEFLVVGENSAKYGYRLRTNDVSLDYNPFEIDSLDLENDGEDESVKTRDKGWDMFIFGMPQKANPRKISPLYFSFDTVNGKIIPATAPKNDVKHHVYQAIRDKDTGRDLCPCCGVSLGKKLAYFRSSSNLLGRLLASTILDNATPMSIEERSEDREILYEGRRYITFTDSRQGTAKFSMALNQDVERNWVRSFLYHKLADQRRDKFMQKGLSTHEQEEYDALKSIQNLPPVLKTKLDKLESLKFDSKEPSAEPISWPNIKNDMEAQDDLTRLFRYLKNARWNTPDDTVVQNSEKSGFLDAMFLDQFGWIPRSSNTLENLGLIHVVYPTLSNAKVPDELGREGFSDEDWRSYLKICVDYQIRGGKHYVVPSAAEMYLMQQSFTKNIYDPESTLKNVTKWPTLSMDSKLSIRLPKLVLLLMAALGMKEPSELTIEKRNLINTVLGKAWRYIRDNVLQITDDTHLGYRLNLLDNCKVKIQILEQGWKCPVDSVVVDTKFRGYSPRMRGCATAENFKRFQIEQEPMKFPYFPYAYRQKVEKDKSKVSVKRGDVLDWIENNWVAQKENGILGNLHSQILYPNPIFLAGEHSAQQQPSVLENYEKSFNRGRLNILSCSTTMEMGVDLKGISAVVMNSVPPKPANYQQRAGRAGRRGETKALTLTFCTPNPVGINAWRHPLWPLEHKTEIPDVKLTSPQIIQRHINAFLFENYVQVNGGMGVKENIREFFTSENMGYEGFCQYLQLMSSEKAKFEPLEARYNSLVAKSCLSNQSLLESMDLCYRQIESINAVYKERLSALNSSCEAAKDSGRSVRNAVENRKNKFLNTSLLGYLAEHNFLPSAGIPTGLVEFNNANNKTENEQKFKKNRKMPTQHLSQAISMYAPGKQVVINNWCFESKGISMKSKFEESKRNIIQSCSNCGYTQIVYGNPLEQCPQCQKNSMMGLKREDKKVDAAKFTEIIEPAGFSVDWSGSCWPTQVIKSDNSTSMVQPLLLQMEPWTNRVPGVKVSIRTSTDLSEILFYNNGAHKAGFMLCPYCGRMESEVDNVVFDRFTKHKHLETGGECEGAGHDGNRIRRNVLLVGRYQTDFVEIKFFDEHDDEVTDQSTLYSLGVIISRKLTEFLGINDGEIDFGYNNKFKSIFIFDTALGGAGYSTLLRDYKNEVFDLARNALNSDYCSKACTRCLVDRSSQWYLNYLDRPKALKWLEMEFRVRNAPSEVRERFGNVETITTDWETEFYRVCRGDDIKSLKIFIDGDISNWVPDAYTFSHQIGLLEARNVECSYVTPEPLDFNKMDLFAITPLISLFYSKHFEHGTLNLNGLRPVLGVEYRDGRKKIYFGKEVITPFGNCWGKGIIYAANYDGDFRFEPLKTDSLSKRFNRADEGMFDFKIDVAQTTAASMFDVMHEYKADKWNSVDEAMSNQESTEITYADKYLNTPLGCVILANQVKSIMNRWKIRPKKINLNLAVIKSGFANGYNDFDSDFSTSERRNEFLKKCFENIVGLEPSIAMFNNLHPRCLEIKGPVCSCKIRPDAGVAWGWALDRKQGSLSLNDYEPGLSADLKLFNKRRSDGILYTVAWKKKE